MFDLSTRSATAKVKLAKSRAKAASSFEFPGAAERKTCVEIPGKHMRESSFLSYQRPSSYDVVSKEWNHLRTIKRHLGHTTRASGDDSQRNTIAGTSS